MFSKLISELEQDNYTVKTNGTGEYFVKCTGLSLKTLSDAAIDAEVSFEVEEGKGIIFDKLTLYVVLLSMKLYNCQRREK